MFLIWKLNTEGVFLRILKLINRFLLILTLRDFADFQNEIKIGLSDSIDFDLFLAKPGHFRKGNLGEEIPGPIFLKL